MEQEPEEVSSGEGGELHIETDKARAGSTPHVVRWILAISLFAAIGLLSAIWMFGAATDYHPQHEVSHSRAAGSGA